jgi:hypothetical protein
MSIVFGCFIFAVNSAVSHRGRKGFFFPILYNCRGLTLLWVYDKPFGFRATSIRTGLQVLSPFNVIANSFVGATILKSGSSHL